MKRTTPITKVDGASLIVYPSILPVTFPEGQRDLVEFKVNIRPIQRAAVLSPDDSPERREKHMRDVVALYIDQRISVLQALKTQVLLGAGNLLDTDTEET